MDAVGPARCELRLGLPGDAPDPGSGRETAASPYPIGQRV
jgi:hypothetical protein